jgi:hypothetical protein
VRLGIVVLLGDGGAQGGDGRLGPARLPQDDREREVRLRQRRIELGGAAQRGFGALEVVLLLQCRAQVVERFGVARVAPSRPEAPTAPPGRLCR